MKDLATTLFTVSSAATPPRCGGLLVAEPFLRETCFNRAVISIIDYLPRDGATGSVLNIPTGYTLPELLTGLDSDINIPVYCGGPLGQDRLYFLHTLGDRIIPNARQYAPGLYVGGEFKYIIDYIRKGYPAEGLLRFFIGYSSWTQGQLEHEISTRTWAQITGPDDLTTIFTGDGDSYWHRAVRHLGPAYRSWQLLPQNPSLN